MNDQNGEFAVEEQAIVREKMEQIYAAPSDPAYWSDLQIRILARIADSDPGLWWVFLGKWARAGIVAAALALMAAGAVSVYAQHAGDRIAVQPVPDNGMPVSVAVTPEPVTTLERVASMEGVSEDEAAVRYVLSLIDGSGR